MKNLFLLCCLSVFLFFYSCSQTTSAVATIETIVVTPSVNQEEFFSRFTGSIEIVPLETKDGLFITNKRVLEVYNGDFYISNVDNGLIDDSRGESNIILRFDNSGKFINKIGNCHKSRPDSYYFYRNFYLDNIAYIFSEDGLCLNKYTLSGEFISKNKIALMDEFENAVFFNNTYIVDVTSYKQNGNNILMFCNEQGEIISKKIPLETQRSPFYNPKHHFTKYKDSLLFTNIYNDTIYHITPKGDVLPRLFVDFGEERRVHKEDYIKNGKWGLDGLNTYFKKSSAGNKMYQESDSYCLLGIDEREPTANGSYNLFRRIALKDKLSGEIAFVDFDTENTLFDDCVQFLEDKKLYFLVQARHITQISEWMRPYFKNLSVLDKITATDNDLIFIFNLK